MDQAKKELKEIQYEDVLNKTEEILKNYKKLSEHIVLTDKEKETLKDETDEFHNKELESIMTGLFSEDELYLESLSDDELASLCETADILIEEKDNDTVKVIKKG